MRYLVLAFGICVLTFSMHASADRAGGPLRVRPHDPGVNARQHNQHGRIAQGVRSGEVTLKEVKKLTVEQLAIRKEERIYKADGKLTVQERKNLHNDLNQSGKHIFENKHDADKRGIALSE